MKTWVSRFSKASTEDLLTEGLGLLAFFIAVSVYLFSYDTAQVKTTLLAMGIPALAALWLMHPASRRNALPKLTLTAPAVLFAGWGCISTFILSPYPMASLPELGKRILYIGLLMIAAANVRDLRQARKVMTWVTCAALLA